MELTDRYLSAVRFFLPKRQHGFVTELADDIRSQIEDKESELGRPLTGEETSAILKKCGHPMIVAGNFFPDQRLIGPPWYAIYLFALKAYLLWILIPGFFLVSLLWALVSDGSSQAFWTVFGHLPSAVVNAVGWITVLFVAIDWTHRRTRLLDNWDPRSLPDIKPERSISRFSSVVEIIFYTLFLLWWVELIRAPQPAGTVVTLAPVWKSLFWSILTLTLSYIAIAFANLLHPWWTRRRTTFHMAMNLACLLILWIILDAGSWIHISIAQLTAEKGAELNHITNLGIKIGLVIAVVITIYEIVTDIRRLVTRRHQPAARASNMVV
jgi:hypothetical protein